MKNCISIQTAYVRIHHGPAPKMVDAVREPSHPQADRSAARIRACESRSRRLRWEGVELFSRPVDDGTRRDFERTPLCHEWNGVTPQSPLPKALAALEA